jgi:uncharacterized protein (UPF0332 family)
LFNEIKDLIDRAHKALASAKKICSEDPDSAASRCYYAVFHTVSAYFLLFGKEFSRHSALEAAVHRDLVNTGTIHPELGQAYSWLVTIRSTGDYGGQLHVSQKDAETAIQKAENIMVFIEDLINKKL